MSLDDAIRAAVAAALDEDLGPDYRQGDITTRVLVGDQRGSAVIGVNEPGVIAGLGVGAVVFRTLDPGIAWVPLVEEGSTVSAGQIVARVEGELRAILSGERTALNFLARLSGVATLTRRFVDEVAGTTAKIYDTRKTTPGLRVLEKYAVRAGGGYNHRLGLYDGILIKDNHLVDADLTGAVAAARATGRPVEVEVETLGQLEEAIAAGAEMVLLDNMDIDTLTEALNIARGKAEVEVSGGIDLQRVGRVAAVGPERISVGAITQGARPLDFALHLESNKDG
jgi:nicotinate-nucleotide pyrophosphorylase (carboxylating)